MAEQTAKPIVLLAFANEVDDRVRYLRKLPEEARRLRRTLDEAQARGLCLVETRTNATLDDLLDVFRRYRNRIALFHFGGHAGSYRLLLEGEAGGTLGVDAEGFAAFLGQQSGLQVVFLNACSTAGQVTALHAAGVPVVIATSQNISDRVATDFSAQFYKSLVTGAGVRDAFQEAAAAVRARRGGDARDLFRAAPVGIPADRVPWALHIRPGAEDAALWSLQAAAGDPLFGLPSLPRLDLPEVPYRHLEWFRRQDAEVFFGRGHEIAELYRRVTAPEGAPIVLFYGQSGVGKSSVLAAGVLPRLEQSQLVHYRRRSQSEGLAGTLVDALSATGTGDLSEGWLRAEARAGKPLTVVLDQVEELFTRPNPELPDEMNGFLDALEGLYANARRRPQGRLILSFRKEWLAEIEKRLEERRLPRAKVFLERLSRQGIVEVVGGPARSPRLRDQYGLTVAPDLPGLIADDLLADRESPVAPMLAILLTGMWEEARARDYDHPTFDQALYEEYRAKGLGLDDFLVRQLQALRGRQTEAVASGLALDVLAYHTTPLGTAEQRTMEDLEQTYRHRATVLPELVQGCRDLYLLVDPFRNQPGQPDASRLTHDTLGSHVRKRFDESDAPGQRARRILENRAREWADAKGSPLDDADLAVVERGKYGMRTWSEAEERLVEASRVESQRKRRNLRIIQGVIAGSVLLSLILAFVALGQRNRALLEKDKAVASGLVAQGQQQYEDDPLLGMRLLFEGWRFSLPEDRTVVEPVLEQQMGRGRFRKIGDDVQSLHEVAGGAMAVVKREFGPGQVWRAADGSVEDLPAGVRAIRYSPDPSHVYVEIEYEDGVRELLYNADGSPVPLSGTLDWVTYSSDPGARYMVLGYREEPDELRTTSDGSLKLRLAGQVERAHFGMDPRATYLVVDYENRPGELIHTDSGSVIGQLSGQVDGVLFSPDRATTYALIGYEDRASELRHTETGKVLIAFASRVTRAVFSEDAAASYVVAFYGDEGELSGEDEVGEYWVDEPPAELWRTEDAGRIATLEHPLYDATDLEDLYWGIGEVTFIPWDTAANLHVEYVEVFPSEVDPDFGTITPAYSESIDVVLSTADGAVVEEPGPIIEATDFPSAPRVYRGDPDAGYAIVQRADDPAELQMPDGSMVPLSGPVEGAIFSPSGRHLVPLYKSREYEVRRTDGTLVGPLDLGSLHCRIAWLAFSPDDHYLALKNECYWYAVSKSWQLYRIDGTLVDTLPIDSELDRVEYSPDGRYIVAYLGERPALIYPLEKPGTSVPLENASWVQFSPAPGADAVLGLYDGRLALRDAGDGSTLGEENGFGSGPIETVSLSPSRRHLVVWREDESSEVWLWDESLRPLVELGLGLAEARFDPAESRLYTRYKDGRAYILDLGWLRELNAEPRPTTVEQWERIFCQGPWTAAGRSDRELDGILFDEPPRACLPVE